MSNIIDRLREAARNISQAGIHHGLQKAIADAFNEAADEIDRAWKESARLARSNGKKEVEIGQYIGEIETLKAQLEAERKRNK